MLSKCVQPMYHTHQCSHPTSPSVINSLKTDRGLALQDLITGAYDNIQGLELPAPSRVYLLDQLALIE